jgi:hypothetical protein
LAFYLRPLFKHKFLKEVFLAGHSGSPLILATLKAEICRIGVQGQHRKKVHDTLPQPIKELVVIALTCHPSLCGKHKQEDLSPDSLDINLHPIGKNN